MTEDIDETICKEGFHAFITEEPVCPPGTVCCCGGYRFLGTGRGLEPVTNCPVCFKELDDHLDAIRCVE